MTACFFAPVESPEILERVKFYADDIRILKELGYEVKVCTRFREIPLGCDLYFVWWWTWATLPLLKARLSNRPTIITGVFDYEIPPKGAGAAYVDRPLWQQLAIRLSLRLARTNIFVSEFERKQIPRHFPGIRAEYVPCAIDLGLYKPSSCPLQDHILCVAWSGQVNALRKCLPQVIQSFALILEKNPTLRLKIAGKQGEYHPKLVQITKDLGISQNVDFMGVISEEEKIRLMQTCRIYLQPTMFEGFGLAIAEAMACGAVVVSSPEGSIPEVVGNAGILVPHNDPPKIAEAVVDILKKPEAHQQLRTKARSQAEHFGYERRKNGVGEVISSFQTLPSKHRAR